MNGVEHREDGEDAEREAEIADAVDDEGLDRGRIGGRLVIPEADEQVAHQPNAFPTEEELEKVIRRDQRQHGEGEEREIGEEARPVRVLVHVADGIEVDEAGHGGDDHEHHGGQRVDAKRPDRFQIAGDDPVHELDADVVALKRDLIEREPGQQARDQNQRRGDGFAGARAGKPPEQAREDRPDQGQEENSLIHEAQLTLQQIDLGDVDGAPVAEIGDDNSEPDGGFSGCDREHDEREDLADEIGVEAGKGDEVQVHRQQHQLDRHQYDDDVLAVEKDAEHAEREQEQRRR